MSEGKYDLFLCVCFFSFLLFLFSSPVGAFSVIFDSHYFAVKGPNATQTATIINDSDKMLPIQVEMVVRNADDSGQEVNTPCTADFMIVPRQLLIQPNDEATVTILWTGEITPRIENAYRLKFSELALPKTDIEILAESNVKGPTAKLDFLTAYVKSVYVIPPPPFQGKAQTILESASPITDPKTRKKNLMLTFYNKGDIHDVLQKVSLTLKPASKGGHSVIVTPSELGYLSLLAESKMKIAIPWPEGLPYGDVEASFKLNL